MGIAYNVIATAEKLAEQTGIPVTQGIPLKVETLRKIAQHLPGRQVNK